MSIHVYMYICIEFVVGFDDLNLHFNVTQDNNAPDKTLEKDKNAAIRLPVHTLMTTMFKDDKLDLNFAKQREPIQGIEFA